MIGVFPYSAAAKLIRFKSETSFTVDVERALKFYLWKYLSFLHQGGNDVLYDVPHNDESGERKERISYRDDDRRHGSVAVHRLEQRRHR